MTSARTAAEPAGGRRSLVERIFEVLECLSGPEECQSISSMCHQTALPPATMHRLLATLVECGAVERPERGQYRLGMRMWLLGWGVPEAREIRDAARPHMVDLYTATRETVVLGYRHGDDLLLVNPIAGNDAGPAWRSNRRMPLGACAAGLIYLAHMDPAVFTARLAGPSLGLPEALRREEFRLLQVLGDIRRTGVASTQSDGQRWWAAPIVNPEGEVRSTLSMIVPEERARPSAHAQLVARAARQVSAALRDRQV